MHIQYAYMQTCRQTRNFVFIVYIRMIVPAAEEGNMGHPPSYEGDIEVYRDSGVQVWVLVL